MGAIGVVFASRKPHEMDKVEVKRSPTWNKKIHVQ